MENAESIILFEKGGGTAAGTPDNTDFTSKG